jgi:hypothetical protein
MACKSCKDKQGASELLNVFKQDNTKEREPSPKEFGFILFNLSIRTILFLISLALVPVILVFVVYLLFKTIILNRGDVNLMPPLLALAKKIGIGKKRVEEEHPEDYEDLDSNNPEDYELVEKVDKVEL